MKTFAPLLLIAGLAIASAAGAATPPASAPKAKPAEASAAAAKRTSCEADWKAQAHHQGSKKTFIKACVAKG
jgi:hypothetical protein